jgi:hypothetical protein
LFGVDKFARMACFVITRIYMGFMGNDTCTDIPLDPKRLAVLDSGPQIEGAWFGEEINC